jgi:hypothetical protein
LENALSRFHKGSDGFVSSTTVVFDVKTKIDPGDSSRTLRMKLFFPVSNTVRPSSGREKEGWWRREKWDDYFERRSVSLLDCVKGLVIFAVKTFCIFWLKSNRQLI